MHVVCVWYTTCNTLRIDIIRVAQQMLHSFLYANNITHIDFLEFSIYNLLDSYGNLHQTLTHKLDYVKNFWQTGKIEQCLLGTINGVNSI